MFTNTFFFIFFLSRIDGYVGYSQWARRWYVWKWKLIWEALYNSALLPQPSTFSSFVHRIRPLLFLRVFPFSSFGPALGHHVVVFSVFSRVLLHTTGRLWCRAECSPSTVHFRIFFVAVLKCPFSLVTTWCIWDFLRGTAGNDSSSMQIWLDVAIFSFDFLTEKFWKFASPKKWFFFRI